MKKVLLVSMLVIAMSSVCFAGDLLIKNVPDDKGVQDEILRNAEATVRNYLDRTIKTIEPAKETAYSTAVDAFKTANNLAEKVVEPVMEPVTEVIK